MTTVTISPKYQVVIPKEVRHQLNLKSGQKVLVLVKEGIVNLIPDKPLKELRGFLKGMKREGFRQEKDRV